MAQREIKTIFSIDGETKYKDAVKDINKEQSLLRAETKAMTAQYELSGDKQKALQTQAQGLAAQIEQQKKKIEEAKNAVEQSTKIYGENSNQTKEYKIQVADAESGLAKLQKQLQNTNKQIALNESGMKTAGEAMTKFGDKAQKVGTAMDKTGNVLTVGLTAPAIAAGSALIQLANKFDEASDKIRIGTGATGEALKGLNDDFDAVIQKVPADMDQAATAIADLNTRLGLTGEPLQNLAQQYLELSVITKEDVTASIKDSTRAFSAWKIPTDKMGDSLNTIFKVSQATGIKVNDLTQKVTNFAPAMQDLGFSFNEATALIGQFEKTGVNTDTVLAALKKSVATFAKEGKSASEGISEITSAIKNAGTESEAARIAIDVFGARSGPELASQIRAGRLDIDAFTKSIESNQETIGKAANDTYDYKEQWKLLTNQLAVELRPVAEQIFKAINNAMPTIKGAAKFVGDLAQKFGELTPKQQETVLKLIAVAAAAGPVLKITGNLTKTIGGASEAIGKFVTKLAEKKAAEVAAKAGTEGLTAAIGGGGGLTSMLGPAGIALGVATAAIGLMALAVYAAEADTRKYNKAIEDTAENASKFVDGVNGAKSALDGFDDSTIWTTENQQKLQEKVDSAQAGITKITSYAVSQRRAMTQDEYDRLQELIDQLGAFADGQIEAYEQKNRIIQAMAQNEKNMTEARAQELIKAAEETRDQIVAIAEAQRIKEYQIADEIRQNAVALRQQGKDQEASIEEARAAEEEKRADERYQKAVNSENKKTADVLKAVQDRYSQTNQAEVDNLNRAKEIYDRLAAIDEDRLKQIAEVSNKAGSTYQDQYNKLTELNEKYAGEESALNDELKDLLDQRTLDVGAAMSGMAGYVELYGGKQSDQAKKATDAILAAYGRLPEESKINMLNSMQSMIDTLKGKQPDLLSTASSVMGGFLNTVKNVLGIRSPSREMRLIAENITKTTADTIKSTSGKVEDAAAGMADAVLGEAARMKQAAEFADYISRSRQSSSRAMSVASGAYAPVPFTPQTTNRSVRGDIVIPVSVNGEFVGEARVTSAELARQEKIRQLALGVEQL